MRDKIKEKFGEKALSRVEIIASNKFGNKEGLKLKFYQSILDGFISIDTLWTSDDVIKDIKNRIDSASDKEREKLILEIVDTYNVGNVEIKQMLTKYERILRKLSTNKPTRK